MSPPSLLRSFPSVTLAAVLVAATGVSLARVAHWNDSALTAAIFWIGVVSVASYYLAHSLIESIKPSLLQNGLWGKVNAQNGRFFVSCVWASATTRL